MKGELSAGGERGNIRSKWKEQGRREKDRNEVERAEGKGECLNDRKLLWNESTVCDMCGAEREDLKPFMLWCPAYTQERRKSERLQQPYPEKRRRWCNWTVPV